MNAAHLHLLLAHLPVVGTLAATLIVAYTLMRFLPATRDLALATIVLVAVTAVAAYATGGGAERILMDIGTRESVIDPHEESAEVALIASLVTAAVAGVAWLARGNADIEKKIFVLLLLLTLGTSVLYARTALLGGGIRHTEMQSAPTVGGGERRHDMSLRLSAKSHA